MFDGRARNTFILITALLLTLALPAAAEGLRVSLGLQGMRYLTAAGAPVDVAVSVVGARVARGRAGLSLSAPLVGVWGGRVAVSDERLAVQEGDTGGSFGLGDMGVGLDYNLLQNRQTEHIYVLTLGGSLRFPTAPTALGIGTGEHLMGLGLSGVYGLTRQLLLYAEARHAWVGVLVPTVARTLVGELGVVYWLTDKLGLTAGLMAADYGSRGGAGVELNLGAMVEVFPGGMMNFGLSGGLPGGGVPLGGASLGLGFEL